MNQTFFDSCGRGVKDFNICNELKLAIWNSRRLKCLEEEIEVINTGIEFYSNCEKTTKNELLLQELILMKLYADKEYSDCKMCCENQFQSRKY